MVVDIYKSFRPATHSSVAARALVLSLTEQAAALQTLADDGHDEMLRTGWRRNPHRGPRYLPPYFPHDVS